MVKNHARPILMAIAAAGLAVSLAGCNWQRDDGQGNPPAGGAVNNPNPSGETVQQPATAETGGVTAPATEQPAAAVGTVEATGTTDPLEAEIDQGLQELDDLNNSADTLEDQP